MDNGWNYYHENLLKKWSEQVKTYSLLHLLSADYYANLEKKLGIPLILLGAITSSMIFLFGQNANMVYVNGALSMLLTIMISVNNFLSASEKHGKHRISANKYQTISLNIDTLLSFPRENRTEKPEMFITDIKSTIIDIRTNSPDVVSFIIKEYIHKLDKSLVTTRTKIYKKSINDNYTKGDYSQDTESNANEKKDIKLRSKYITSQAFNPTPKQISNNNCDGRTEFTDCKNNSTYFTPPNIILQQNTTPPSESACIGKSDSESEMITILTTDHNNDINENKTEPNNRNQDQQSATITNKSNIETHRENDINITNKIETHHTSELTENYTADHHRESTNLNKNNLTITLPSGRRNSFRLKSPVKHLSTDFNSNEDILRITNRLKNNEPFSAGVDSDVEPNTAK